MWRVIDAYVDNGIKGNDINIYCDIGTYDTKSVGDLMPKRKRLVADSIPSSASYENGDNSLAPEV